MHAFIHLGTHTYIHLYVCMNVQHIHITCLQKYSDLNTVSTKPAIEPVYLKMYLKTTS